MILLDTVVEVLVLPVQHLATDDPANGLLVGWVLVCGQTPSVQSGTPSCGWSRD